MLYVVCKQINPTECKILLTDPPLNPSKNREKMVCDPICLFTDGLNFSRKLLLGNNELV